MKFANREQQKNVVENIESLLIDISKYANEEMQGYIKIAIRILEETEIETK